MFHLKGRALEIFNASLKLNPGCLFLVQRATLKLLVPPPNYDDVEYPEKPKLKFLEKVPQFPSNVRPPKSAKRIIYMRGPELIHNNLYYDQYGIIATTPGRLKHGHMEMIRMTMARRINVKNMFATWRVDPPWQPMTKKGQGKRMGGGKGSIDHYVTPIKAGRVIIEMGGHCNFQEVMPILREIISKLPFRSIAVSKESLKEMREKEKLNESLNQNPYTFKYLIQNNMAMTHHFISPYDRIWFGKYR